jgi:flagellar biosynthesis activator protein FlaF
MYQFSYADVIDERPATGRARERAAILHTIELMSAAEADGPRSRKAVEALHSVQRLWSLLIEDLAKPENELPGQLRADLISIGLWNLREVENIRHGRAGSFESLIEVSAAIAGGLS